MHATTPMDPRRGGGSAGTRCVRFGRTVVLACTAGAFAWVPVAAWGQAEGVEVGPVADEPSASADSAGVAAVAGVQDGNRHVISSVEIVFLSEHPDLPSAAEVLGGTVSLTRTSTGWIGQRAAAEAESVELGGLPTLGDQRFYDTALTLVIQAVSERLSALDLLGVYAEADPSQFELVDGRVVDLREAGDTSLRVLVTTARVAQVRTSALGERFGGLVEGGDDEDGVPAVTLIDLPQHARIREASPITPREDDEGRLPVLRRGEISDYSLRLSRHPGRRVDISIAPAALEPGSVTLDYLITENKPWLVYFQLSNTGTEATNEWQERFGFIHNQLTDADDVFTVEYTTNTFDGTNSVFTSYERPLALDGRLRGRVYGSYYEYDASNVGQPGLDFEGDGVSLGGEGILNVVQIGDSFVDAVAGLRYDRIEVTNDLALNPEGEEDILVGYAGLRFERAQRVNQTFADVSVEWSLNGVDGDESNSLGRTDVDENWVVLKGGLSQSVYLETLFDSDLAESGSLAHEIALSARGQWAFDNRLVPNYQQVAGGLLTVRGYEQSIVAGDNAFVASAEYRFHLPRSFAPNPEPVQFFGDAFRFAPQYRTGPVDWDFQIKGFIDVARVGSSDDLAFERDETLIGAGFGFELAIRRNLRARVDFGWALEEVEDQIGQTIVDTGDNEVHFALTLAY